MSSSSSALTIPAKLLNSKANANQRQAAPIVDVRNASLCNWNLVLVTSIWQVGVRGTEGRKLGQSLAASVYVEPAQSSRPAGSANQRAARYSPQPIRTRPVSQQEHTFVNMYNAV